MCKLAKMRLKLISCQVFCREAEAVIARACNWVDVEFLPKGLHELPCAQMCDRLQAVLDGVDPGRFDAVAFAYGFCSHGLAGLRARTLPLVVPRAHDCITLLLGSHGRYMKEFDENPGTYYRSCGWLENAVNPDDINALSFARRNNLHASFEELAARYGEEDARYLMGAMGGGHPSIIRAWRLSKPAWSLMIDSNGKAVRTLSVGVGRFKRSVVI
jgi:hypothetical protein